MIGHLMFFLFNRGRKAKMPMSLADYNISIDKCLPEVPIEIAFLIERGTYYEPADRIPINELILRLIEFSRKIAN